MLLLGILSIISTSQLPNGIRRNKKGIQRTLYMYIIKVRQVGIHTYEYILYYVDIF